MIKTKEIICHTRGMNVADKDGEFSCRYRGKKGQTDLRGNSVEGKCLLKIVNEFQPEDGSPVAIPSYLNADSLPKCDPHAQSLAREEAPVKNTWTSREGETE